MIILAAVPQSDSRLAPYAPSPPVLSHSAVRVFVPLLLRIVAFCGPPGLFVTILHSDCFVSVSFFLFFVFPVVLWTFLNGLECILSPFLYDLV